MPDLPPSQLPHRSPAPRRGLYHGLIAALLLLSLIQMAAAFRLGAVHGNDFKHLYAGAMLLAYDRNPYAPAELLRFAAGQGWVDSGGAPVINPFVYYPTTGLFLRPLVDLNFSDALGGWVWFNWALAWAWVLWGPLVLKVERRDLARLAGAVFLAAALPFFRQQTAGQMNVITLWIVGLAAGLLLRQRESISGAALALGAAWKIAPLALIAALAPLRRWRGLAVGFFGVAALAAAAWPLYGAAITSNALGVIGQMGYGRSTWEELGRAYYRDPFNQSPNSFFHHILTENPETSPWLAAGPGWANAVTVGFTMLLVGVWLFGCRLLWRANRHAHPTTLTRLFLAASVLMLLAPSIMWDHYAVQLLPALVWLFGDARAARQWPRALGAAALLAALCIPWSPFGEVNRSGAGVMLMSLRLWPTLALFGWLCVDAAERETAPAPQPVTEAR